MITWIINLLNKPLSYFNLKIIWLPKTGSGVFIPPQDGQHLVITVKGGGGGGSGTKDGQQHTCKHCGAKFTGNNPYGICAACY